MPRRVDEKKTRKALAKLARAKRKAGESGETIEFSDWEAEFLDSVGERLEEFGSAFANPEKGDLSEPLSALQSRKIKEIEKKAAGKDRKPMKRGGGLKARKPMGQGKNGQDWTPRVRDISEEEEEEADADADAPPAAAPEPPRPDGPPKLSIIKGGKEDKDR